MLATIISLADRRGRSPCVCKEVVSMRRIIMLVTVAALMVAMLSLAGWLGHRALLSLWTRPSRLTSCASSSKGLP